MTLQTPVIVQNELGIDLTQTYNPATVDYPGLPFLPGTQVVATNGSEWIFCTANATLTQYQAVWIDPTFVAVGPTGGVGTRPENGAGQIGFLQYVPAGNLSATTIASGISFWAMTKGVPIILCQSAGVNVALYTSETAGALTGSTNTASHNQIMGITCIVTASGSTASATSCYASFPVVSRTGG